MVQVQRISRRTRWEVCWEMLRAIVVDKTTKKKKERRTQLFWVFASCIFIVMLSGLMATKIGGKGTWDIAWWENAKKNHQLDEAKTFGTKDENPTRKDTKGSKEVAQPIYGIRRLVPMPKNLKKNDKILQAPPVEVVYSLLPSSSLSSTYHPVRVVSLCPRLHRAL